MFERVQSTIFEICSTLKNSEIIRKLVYHDSNAALSMESPPVSEVEEYIVIQPIFDMCDTPEHNINTLIQVELDQSDAEDISISGVLRINVVCNAVKWRLINNKIRPLTIVDEIIRLIDKKKFSISNTLEFESCVPLIINKSITGYSLLFNFNDGSSDINNF